VKQFLSLGPKDILVMSSRLQRSSDRYSGSGIKYLCDHVLDIAYRESAEVSSEFRW